MKTYRHYNTIALILGILAIFTSFFIQNQIINLLFGLFYTTTTSYFIGKLFFNNQKILENTILGFLLSVFIAIFLGTILFYVYALNNFFIIITLLILSALALFSLKTKNANQNKTKQNIAPKINRDIKTIFNKSFLLIATYLILIIILLYTLISYSTDLPINTPWATIPKYFFTIFFIASLNLIALLVDKNRLSKKINYKLILISIHTFIIFGIVYFTYKLGYGFDPFIHRATLKIIWDTGTIAPKPFYYIGQYSLIFYFSKIFGISLYSFDKILVPLLSSIFIPTILYFYLNSKPKPQEENNKKLKDYLIIISLLIIPFSSFIATTPQNLANLFFVVLIILSLSFNNNLNNLKIFILILNTLAILCIHPLAGIPAVIFLSICLLWFKYLKQNKYSSLYYKLMLFAVFISFVSLPAIWLFNSIISSQTTISINNNIKQSIINYAQNLSLLHSSNTGQFNIILNSIYLFYFNIPLILLIIFIYGVKKLYKDKNIKNNYLPYLLSTLIFFINYLILKIFLNFDFLINYEQQNYTNRVLDFSLLFLLPFIILFLKSFWEKSLKQALLFRYIIFILLAIFLTTGLYFTYPRHDNITANHGYGLSKFDIEAVNYINDNASDDFIVLSNQQVAVAGLQEFGFKKYYPTTKGEVFYYPIPTGGPLYQYYLEIVNNKPAKKIVNEAMNLVEVSESYLVINKYWWDFDRIVDWAKLQADEYKIIGNEDLYIFKFIK